MLNGVAPVLIINFIKKKDNSTGRFLSGIPLVGGDLAGALTGGLPIPLYLDEMLTGMYVMSETKTIAVETEVKALVDGTKPKISQRAVDSTVTVVIEARRTNILMVALLALNDQIFQKVASKEYSVSYLNGSTVVLNALFSGFTSMAVEGTDKLSVTITLSKANQLSTKPVDTNPVIAPSVGEKPLTAAAV